MATTKEALKERRAKRMLVLSELKTELNTDPGTRGYAALITAGNHVGLADLLNAVDQSIDINRTSVSRREVMESIVWSEFEALTAAKRNTIGILMTLDSFDVNSANVKDGFLDAFGAGTATRTNLNGLLNRKGSRAEELFGDGVTVTHTDVAQALALP